jgi:hypothetical protein
VTLEEFLAARVCSCGRGGKLTSGMCTRCYRYWLDHTPPEDRPPAPRFVRQFWDFVCKDGPVPSHAPELGQCWVWTGQTDPKGYGRWSKVIASRHSWALANGQIPDGMWVLHHCDNPPCVRPDHLYLGTVVENVRDAVERGQHYRPPRKERCTKGHLKEGDNLRVIVRGSRTNYLCRQCDNERSRERMAAKRLAGKAA